MTNYEKYYMNNHEELKSILSRNIGVDKTTKKPTLCLNLVCSDCEFCSKQNGCRKNTEEWLNQEYKAPFHVGDVVICGEYNCIGFVIAINGDEVIVSPYQHDVEAKNVKFLLQRYDIDEVRHMVFYDKDGD